MRARTYFLLLSSSVFLLWLAYPRLIDSAFAEWLVPAANWPTRGVIGDSFGALNALFAGIGIAGLAVNIYLQSRQLRNVELREVQNERQLIEQSAAVRRTALLQYYNDEIARLERLVAEYERLAQSGNKDETVEQALFRQHGDIRKKRDALVSILEKEEQ